MQEHWNRGEFMRLDQIKTNMIVPEFLLEDKTVRGFCAAADIIVQRILEKINLVNLFQSLSDVTEEDLDYIAKMEEIPWYDTSYTRTQKEKIIKGFEKNCMFLGTGMAVKNILSEIFGDHVVQEWYEYGGEVKHYSVKTEFVGDIEKAASDYEKRIGQVKSFRSVLDGLAFFQKVAMEHSVGILVIPQETVIIKEGSENG